MLQILTEPTSCIGGNPNSVCSVRKWLIAPSAFTIGETNDPMPSMHIEEPTSCFSTAVQWSQSRKHDTAPRKMRAISSQSSQHCGSSSPSSVRGHAVDQLSDRQPIVGS